MFESYIIGIGGIVLLMIMWIVVQVWWGRIFADHVDDDDVLAGRSQCSNCGCVTICKEHGEKLLID